MRTRITRKRQRKIMPEHSTSVVEYGLLVAAIAALIMAMAFSLTDVIGATFQQTSDCRVGPDGVDAACAPDADG